MGVVIFRIILFEVIRRGVGVKFFKFGQLFASVYGIKLVMVHLFWHALIIGLCIFLIFNLLLLVRYMQLVSPCRKKWLMLFLKMNGRGLWNELIGIISFLLGLFHVLMMIMIRLCGIG